MVSDISLNLGHVAVQFSEQKFNVRDQTLSAVDLEPAFNPLRDIRQPIIDQVSISSEALQRFEADQRLTNQL